MIGILEVIFSIIIFCVIWFIIFKIKLIHDKKKPFNDIEEKIEKQEQIFISDGKTVNLKKELGLQKESPENKEIRAGEKKKSFFSRFKRGKKEDDKTEG